MLVALNELGIPPRSLPELLKHVAAGEDVVLTYQGSHIARLMPLTSSQPTNEPSPSSHESKMALMDRIRKAGSRKALAGPNGARSQDFLYDEDGLPA